MDGQVDDKGSSSNFGIYSGGDILKRQFKKRDPLIENLIREKDSVILVGAPKTAKSLLVLQLICSATSQHPFLDKYKVMKPCRISYIQLEGEIEDTQDRLRRMYKTVDCDLDKVQVLFYPPLGLEEEKNVVDLKTKLVNFKPDIVIIDPLYFAFRGSLSEDGVVRRFIGNLRVLKEALGCAMLLVAHTHKTRINYKEGKNFDEGDEAIFGSVFFKAWPDHVLLLEYDKRNDIRILSCSTQRSGTVIEQCKLKLVEPDPLYFEETEVCPTKETVILSLLMKEEHKGGLTADQIMEITSMGHTTFYKSVKKPLAEGTMGKTIDRPVKYYYKVPGEK